MTDKKKETLAIDPAILEYEKATGATFTIPDESVIGSTGEIFEYVNARPGWRYRLRHR
jgi:hypothetical protein